MMRRNGNVVRRHPNGAAVQRGCCCYGKCRCPCSHADWPGGCANLLDQYALSSFHIQQTNDYELELIGSATISAGVERCTWSGLSHKSNWRQKTGFNEEWHEPEEDIEIDLVFFPEWFADLCRWDLTVFNREFLKNDQGSDVPIPGSDWYLRFNSEDYIIASVEVA